MYRRIACLTALVAVTFSVSNTQAADRTWSSTAAALGFWSSNTAWAGGTAPVASDNLFYTVAPVAGGTRTTTNDFAANTQFGSITMINAYILNGSAINLAGNVTNNANLAIASINLNMALQQDTTFAVNFGGNTRIDVAGDISGGYGINKVGLGALRITTTAKTYTGATTITAGSIDIVSGGLPVNTDLSIASGAFMQLNNASQTVDGLSGAGNVTKIGSGARGLTIGQNNEASANFTGNLIQSAGTLSLTKVGTGTQILSGTGNTYTGATAVNGGTLVVNGTIGSGNTTVAALGTLAGAGTLGGVTTVNGQLDPGSAAGVIGTLSFTTNLTLGATASALFQLDRTAGQNADLLNVLGGLTLGGTVNVANIGASLIAGDLFDLFNSPSITGTFGTLNLPSLDPGLSWDISQLTINGTISVISVPEPSSMALAGIAGLSILIAKRRKA